jgi:hypothetical protein
MGRVEGVPLWTGAVVAGGLEGRGCRRQAGGARWSGSAVLFEGNTPCPGFSLMMTRAKKEIPKYFN